MSASLFPVCASLLISFKSQTDTFFINLPTEIIFSCAILRPQVECIVRFLNEGVKTMKHLFFTLCLVFAGTAFGEGLSSIPDQLIDSLPGLYHGKAGGSTGTECSVEFLSDGTRLLVVIDDPKTESLTKQENRFGIAKTILRTRYSDFSKEFRYTRQLGLGSLWSSPPNKILRIAYTHGLDSEKLYLLGAQITYNEEHDMFQIPIQRTHSCWGLRRN